MSEKSPGPGSREWVVEKLGEATDQLHRWQDTGQLVTLIPRELAVLALFYLTRASLSPIQEPKQ